MGRGERIDIDFCMALGWLICCDRDLGQNRNTRFNGGLLFCEQSDIISIREVLLVMLYRLVSSLYQVFRSMARHSDA